jgi:hypothetical protein
MIKSVNKHPIMIDTVTIDTKIDKRSVIQP